MFQKATRKQVKLKLALTGPSGGGKTMSALRLSKGLGKKIALIDSENGSASLYSDKFDFDVVDIDAPFTIEKFIDAIDFAEKQNYEIIILDSISQVWAGEGGLLSEKEKLDARPGSNSFTNWSMITKRHEKFKSAILNSPCHIICTMRSKMDYALSTNDKGKLEPKKIGLAPIQRDGLEYDFSIVFDVAMDHNALASKDRTGLFNTQIPFQITEDTGHRIINWLNSASPKSVVTEIIPQFDSLAQGASLIPKRISVCCNLEMKYNPDTRNYFCPKKQTASDNHQLINIPSIEKEKVSIENKPLTQIEVIQ
jgi:hypothetical protein